MPPSMTNAMLNMTAKTKMAGDRRREHELRRECHRNRGQERNQHQRHDA
jgi:hypothetical protein